MTELLGVDEAIGTECRADRTPAFCVSSGDNTARAKAACGVHTWQGRGWGVAGARRGHEVLGERRLRGFRQTQVRLRVGFSGDARVVDRLDGLGRGHLRVADARRCAEPCRRRAVGPVVELRQHPALHRRELRDPIELLEDARRQRVEHLLVHLHAPPAPAASTATTASAQPWSQRRSRSVLTSTCMPPFLARSCSINVSIHPSFPPSTLGRSLSGLALRPAPCLPHSPASLTPLPPSPPTARNPVLRPAPLLSLPRPSFTATVQSRKQGRCTLK